MVLKTILEPVNKSLSSHIDPPRDRAMQLHFPVLKPLEWIKDSVESLEYKLTRPQLVNLTLILTAMITCNTLCLSTLSQALLGQRSINALSHFFSTSFIISTFKTWPCSLLRSQPSLIKPRFSGLVQKRAFSGNTL